MKFVKRTFVTWMFMLQTKLIEKNAFLSYRQKKEAISKCLRDGPFDIQGGGAGIFARDKLFFLSFCATSYFFQK